MIKIFLNENNRPVMKSDSIVQSYIFLWSLVVILRLLDAWFIMVVAGGIHHIFNTNWLPPSFWLSMAISMALTTIKYSKIKVEEALKMLELK